YRMTGGKFQGSSDGVSYTDLYTINSEPGDSIYTTATISSTSAYRYVRYLSPDGGYGNVSELEFYGPISGTPATVSGTRLAGAMFGTPGSWSNSGNTFDRALDGSTSSFFDAPGGNG